MIKAASLFTFEADEDLACKELKEQLSEKLTLKKNTVGIVQCNHEFIEAGVIKRFYEETGIPLCGGTTIATATSSEASSLILSMLVLTSDDVDFTVSHTDGFAGDYQGAIKRSLGAAFDNSQKKPGLAMVFLPLIESISGDYFVDAIEAACGKMPIFGTTLLDDSFPDFSQCLAIYNDKALSYEMSYVLFCGEVTPRFLVAAVPPKIDITESGARITKAKGNIVYELNNMTAGEYMENIGLLAKGTAFKDALNLLLPFLVTIDGADDTRPFVRSLLHVLADGSAIFTGEMYEGAEVAFGSNNSDDIMAATTEAVTLAAGEKDINAALIFSCISRQLVIGFDSMKELKQIQNILPESLPYIASFSGGEFSPTSVDSENIAQNRYHNYSLIICLL